MIKEKRMFLREASAEDLVLIFEWANEYAVRQNSFSSKEISLEEHTAWFSKMMERDDVKQYILTNGSQDVGQIRVTVDGEKAEIGYSIAEEFRGNGYGKLIVSMLPERVKQDFPNVTKLIAKVKPENIASQKVFINEGYVELCVVYELPV